VGELAALDSQNRLATAIAIEPLTMQSLTAEEFRAFIAEHSSAALELIRMLIGRLREADRRRAEFGVHDTTRRVAHLLAELAAEHQPPEHGPTQVQLSQQEIDELIGASRESVARGGRFAGRRQSSNRNDARASFRRIELSEGARGPRKVRVSVTSTSLKPGSKQGSRPHVLHSAQPRRLLPTRTRAASARPRAGTA
jgi:CRP-like cAMP-binding protein